MSDNPTAISNLIRDQFPDFYKEQGEGFITFIQAYYEWLETDRNIVAETRSLLSYRDIDTTLDDFLIHFRNKFMNGIDDSIIGNQRLFQKHILDLYRSKGSLSGLKLFFRLLFNEDVETYIPSEDVLIASDGIWVIPYYIEVDYQSNIWSFENKTVRGSKTGATAFVERIESKSIDSRPAYILYMSNIKGTFSNTDVLTYGDLTTGSGLIIKGTPVNLNVVTSSPNFKTGDIIVDVSTTHNPKPLKAVVTEVYDSVGIINFNIEDGGTYYSVDAQVTISPGSNTTGIGADFKVQSITNAVDFLYSTDLIVDYETVPLNSSNYGFPTLINSDINTRLIDALTIDIVRVGTINRLLVLNPGTGYDGSVNISVVDPYTSSRGILNPDGSIGGLDAVITGTSETGTGLVSKVAIIDSSFGYNTEDQILSLEYDEGIRTVSVSVDLGGLGNLEGYYDDTKGFLSSNKYLFDGHFYQNFSYVIKSSRQLDEYIKIYKDIMHMAGNRVYGRLVFTEKTNMDVKNAFTSVVSVKI